MFKLVIVSFTCPINCLQKVLWLLKTSISSLVPASTHGNVASRNADGSQLNHNRALVFVFLVLKI